MNWYFGEFLPVEFPHLQPQLVQDGQVGRGCIGAPVLKARDLIQLLLLGLLAQHRAAAIE